MSSAPTHPDETQETVSAETERILRERDAVFEQEYPKREEAEEAIRDIRRSLALQDPR
jgi:hypothetical protein